MQVPEEARVHLLYAALHSALEAEPFELARHQLVGAHERVGGTLLPVLAEGSPVGLLRAVDAWVLVWLVVVRLYGVVHHVNVDDFTLGQKLGGEVQSVLDRALVVSHVHRLYGNVEAVLHVVRVGEDRLVVRVAIPRVLVYLQRALWRQGADHAGNLAAQVVYLARVLPRAVVLVVAGFVRQNLHTFPASSLVLTHLGDGEQLTHAVLLQGEGQYDTILLYQHGFF